MSTSRAIKKPKRDTQLSNFQPIPERAPSVEMADVPTVARVLAMVGLFFTVLGALAMYAPRWQRVGVISPDWGYRIITVGICLLLYHAFVERDLQFRRIYSFVGLGLILGGVVLRAMAFRPGYVSWFFYYGLPALGVGLPLLLAMLRSETEIQFRNLMLNCVGIVGALLILFTAYMGMRDGGYLAGEGVVLLLLALGYIGVYIGQETNVDRAYYVALALGGVGVLGLVVGVVRSFLPESNFFVPGGLILIGMSLVYLVVAIGICSDLPVVVLARRELAAYFYSPIAYLVLIALAVYSGFVFWFFAFRVTPDPLDPRGASGVMEPIIGSYIFAIFPVFAQMFIVPALTMRLFSEEKRTGSLEVLMTAPVSELSVVLGKFLACWIFYMLTWVPWWVYLVSLRYIGGESFDYLPAISFTVAIGFVSAGLLAMGLFFSAMTSNQLIAAVLTFVGVMMHLVLYFLRQLVPNLEGGTIDDVVRYVNFFDLWEYALDGIIAPRLLVYHLSVTIFFLFATVKMLEARKWN